MNVPAELVRQQIHSILSAWGLEQPALGITVEAMVATDLSGVDSHGISMLMSYEEMMRVCSLLVKMAMESVQSLAISLCVAGVDRAL